MKYKKTLLFFSFLVLLSGWLLYAYVPKFVVEVKNPVIEQARLNFYSEYAPKNLQQDDFKGFTYFSADSLQLKANFYPAKQTPKATIILLHGIRSQKEQLDSLARWVSRQGFNAVAVDLRAHGQSEGAYCTYGYYEKNDMVQLIDYLTQVMHVKPPFGIWGHSLGGAISLQTLAIEPRIHFGIVESAYADFSQITKDYSTYYAGFQSDWLNDFVLERAGELAQFPINQVNPIDYVTNIRQPILLVHGTKDAKIKRQNATVLYEKIGSDKKQLLWVEGAHHTDIHQVGGAVYFKKVLAFINENLYPINL